jgi:hypothetical protein
MAKKPYITGSQSYKDRGYLQISVYIHPDVIPMLDRLAKSSRRSRTGVITNIVFDELMRLGSECGDRSGGDSGENVNVKVKSKVKRGT